jgi:hypothetical protein
VNDEQGAGLQDEILPIGADRRCNRRARKWLVGADGAGHIDRNWMMLRAVGRRTKGLALDVGQLKALTAQERPVPRVRFRAGGVLFVCPDPVPLRAVQSVRKCGHCVAAQRTQCTGPHTSFGTLGSAAASPLMNTVDPIKPTAPKRTPAPSKR